jgi:hypothetical protein
VKKFVAAAAVGMAALALHPGSARADTSAGRTEATKAAELVQDVNDLRISNGLPALVVDDELTAKAAAWARTMAGAGRIWHCALPDGITADWAALGENVGTAGTVEQLHQAFVNSPHHYENLVRPDYQYIGVGIADVDGVLYASEVFMKLRPATPPASRPPANTPPATPHGSSAATPAAPVAIPTAVRTIRAATAPPRTASTPAVKPTSQAAVPPVDRAAHEDAATVRAATETPVTSPPTSPVALPPASHGAATGAPETPRFHLASYATHRPNIAAAHHAASGVAVLIWAAVTAGLITMRSGRNRRWRPARRRTMSDEELRELVGIRPATPPAT